MRFCRADCLSLTLEGGTSRRGPYRLSWSDPRHPMFCMSQLSASLFWDGRPAAHTIYRQTSRSDICDLNHDALSIAGTLVVSPPRFSCLTGLTLDSPGVSGFGSRPVGVMASTPVLLDWGLRKPSSRC